MVVFYTIMITSSFYGAKGNHYKRNIVIFSINSLLFFMSLSPCVRILSICGTTIS